MKDILRHVLRQSLEQHRVLRHVPANQVYRFRAVHPLAVFLVSVIGYLEQRVGLETRRAIGRWFDRSRRAYFLVLLVELQIQSQIVLGVAFFAKFIRALLNINRARDFAQEVAAYP